MSREPVDASHNDAESALSDDELEGVVGGVPGGDRPHFCSHGQRNAHGNCPGPGIKPPVTEP